MTPLTLSHLDGSNTARGSRQAPKSPWLTERSSRARVGWCRDLRLRKGKDHTPCECRTDARKTAVRREGVWVAKSRFLGYAEDLCDAVAGPVIEQL
jgi:hypothetical protein